MAFNREIKGCLINQVLLWSDYFLKVSINGKLNCQHWCTLLRGRMPKTLHLHSLLTFFLLEK